MQSLPSVRCCSQVCFLSQPEADLTIDSQDAPHYSEFDGKSFRQEIQAAFEKCSGYRVDEGFTMEEKFGSWVGTCNFRKAAALGTFRLVQIHRRAEKYDCEREMKDDGRVIPRDYTRSREDSIRSYLEDIDRECSGSGHTHSRWTIPDLTMTSGASSGTPLSRGHG